MFPNTLFGNSGMQLPAFFIISTDENMIYILGFSWAVQLNGESNKYLSQNFGKMFKCSKMFRGRQITLFNPDQWSVSLVAGCFFMKSNPSHLIRVISKHFPTVIFPRIGNNLVTVETEVCFIDLSGWSPTLKPQESRSRICLFFSFFSLFLFWYGKLNVIWPFFVAWGF